MQASLQAPAPPSSSSSSTTRDPNIRFSSSSARSCRMSTASSGRGAAAPPIACCRAAPSAGCGRVGHRSARMELCGRTALPCASTDVQHPPGAPSPPGFCPAHARRRPPACPWFQRPPRRRCRWRRRRPPPLSCRPASSSPSSCRCCWEGERTQRRSGMSCRDEGTHAARRAAGGREGAPGARA